LADGCLSSMDGVVAVLEVLQLLRSMARPLPNAPTRGGLRVAGVGRADVRVCLVGCLHGRGARAIARVEPEDMKACATPRRNHPSGGSLFPLAAWE